MDRGALAGVVEGIGRIKRRRRRDAAIEAGIAEDNRAPLRLLDRDDDRGPLEPRQNLRIVPDEGNADGIGLGHLELANVRPELDEMELFGFFAQRRPLSQRLCSRHSRRPFRHARLPCGNYETDPWGRQ